MARARRFIKRNFGNIERTEKVAAYDNKVSALKIVNARVVKFRARNVRHYFNQFNYLNRLPIVALINPAEEISPMLSHFIFNKGIRIFSRSFYRVPLRLANIRRRLRRIRKRLEYRLVILF
jgi:hypothetical protein